MNDICKNVYKHPKSIHAILMALQFTLLQSIYIDTSFYSYLLLLKMYEM